MRYLKLFEKFDDNKEVVDTLKKIIICVKTGEKITSKINGGTAIDLHDRCSDEKVIEVLSKTVEVIDKEIQGTQVHLKSIFDVNELEGLIQVLEDNPKRQQKIIKLENFSKFIKESHTKSIQISEDEMNLFSQESSLQELITKSKITLKNGEVLYDETDKETKELLSQYLKISE